MLTRGASNTSEQIQQKALTRATESKKDRPSPWPSIVVPKKGNQNCSVNYWNLRT